jgi:hypothetical protein
MANIYWNRNKGIMNSLKKQCGASHTKYQPSESEFVCPGCGEKDGDFFIDTFSDDTNADNDCFLLHYEDVLIAWNLNPYRVWK